MITIIDDRRIREDKKYAILFYNAADILTKLQAGWAIKQLSDGLCRLHKAHVTPPHPSPPPHPPTHPTPKTKKDKKRL